MLADIIFLNMPECHVFELSDYKKKERPKAVDTVCDEPNVFSDLRRSLSEYLKILDDIQTPRLSATSEIEELITFTRDYLIYLSARYIRTLYNLDKNISLPLENEQTREMTLLVIEDKAISMEISLKEKLRALSQEDIQKIQKFIPQNLFRFVFENLQR